MPSVNRAGPMNPMKPFLEKRPSPRLSGPKLLGGLILFGLCVTLHAQLTCTVDGLGGAAVRREGFSERTADILIHCHGGTPLAAGTPLPTVDITVYLNATITSRIYSNGWSEVLLLVDNPGGNFNYVPSTPLACNDPNGICPITGRGNGAGAYDGSPGRPNIFQGTVSGNAITFTSIPFDQPGTSVRMLRITNIRVNATFASVFGIQAMVNISGTSVHNAVSTVANSDPALGFSVRTPDNSAPSSGFAVTPCSTSGTQRIGVLRFQSGSLVPRTKTAFVDSDTSPTPVAQNLLSYDNTYDSESGFYYPSLTTPNGDFGTIGLANAGTRLKAVLNNIPAGTSVYVSTNRVDYANGNPLVASNGLVARLVQSEEGPFTPLAPTTTLEGIPAVQLPVTNGTATAVWEVLRGTPFTLEIADFPIWVLSAGTSPASVTVNGSYAPTPLSDGGVASSTSPLPRFMADAQTASSLFSVGACLQPALSISKTHSGNFTQGQSNAVYTVNVSNQAGAGPTIGIVTVTETAPTGLTLVSMAGTGWTCLANTCTRSDPIGGGSSYPPITVAVNVSGNATSPLTNSVSVSGGGSAGANAADLTTMASEHARTASTRHPTGSVRHRNRHGHRHSPAGLLLDCYQQCDDVAQRDLGNTGQRKRDGGLFVRCQPNPHAPLWHDHGRGPDLHRHASGKLHYRGLRFVPLTPCRIADTRKATGPFGGPNLAAGSVAISPSIEFLRYSRVGWAYSLNLTVIPLAPLGYISIWPAGQPKPVVSTLNSFDGRIKANAAIVPAGPNGAFTLYATDPTNVAIDINGYFVPASGSQNLAFYPVTPCRVADTRNPTGTFGAPALAGGVPRTFPVSSSSCGIPASAQAYAFNMTVVPTGLLGYLSTWPAGSPQPLVSTLNALTGAVTSNASIVPAGVNGAISVYASDTTDLIIDINGYFAPPGTGSLDFYTATPCRVLDTRNRSRSLGRSDHGGRAIAKFQRAIIQRAAYRRPRRRIH